MLQENGVLVKKVAAVQISDSAKKTEAGESAKNPTMRKKSMKRKKMTDQEIMDALRMCTIMIDVLFVQIDNYNCRTRPM